MLPVESVIGFGDINEDLIKGLAGALGVLHLKFSFNARSRAASFGEEAKSCQGGRQYLSLSVCG